MLNKITKETTLIIIDWDDTLLPSSAILKEIEDNNKIIFNMDFDIKSYDKCKNEINIILIDFVKYIKTLGKVVIITSSKKNWVIYSAKEYLSCEAVDILEETDIYYVDEVLNKWGLKNTLIEKKKQVVFELVIKEWINMLNDINDKKINIISLGDGFQELNAYFYISEKSILNEKYDMIYKHIKYLNFPTYNELLREYKLVKNSLINIINSYDSNYYKIKIVFE